MHHILHNYLNQQNWGYFLHYLNSLDESTVEEIMQKNDIISFFVACHTGKTDFINNRANLLLHDIRSHNYFAFQVAMWGGQIDVMRTLGCTISGNEWHVMLKKDHYLSSQLWNWLKEHDHIYYKISRDYMRKNDPESYAKILQDKYITPSKRDSEWNLEIHQLDVGQGDSALVLFKKLNKITGKYEVNKSILIDGGLYYNADYIDDYLNDKIGEERSLDAVIITHFDADHYLGIAHNMFAIESSTGGKGIKAIIAPNPNSHFTKNTKFILPKVSQESGSRNRSSEIFHDALVTYYGDEIMPGVFRNIIRGRDCIDRSIWEIIGGDRSDGAPNLKIIAADNVLQRGATSLGSINDNSRSTASIIGMKGFHYYTAGDFENSSYLMNYLIQTPNSTDYLPIQAFLTPHHGSSNNLIDNAVLNKVGARSAIISAGGGGYDHPDRKALNSLNNSEVDYIYATNPIPPAQRVQSRKIIEAGNGFITNSNPQNKTPRGTIKIKTYSNISEIEKEKFLIKFRNSTSKTRDYYKDKDFTALKYSLLQTIGSYDNDFANGNKGETLVINLSKSDLRHFMDEDSKIKHINPTTLSRFFLNYSADNSYGEGYNYTMYIFSDDNMIGFKIESNLFYKNNKEYKKRFGNKELAQNFYNELKSLGIGVGNSVGLFFDDLSEVLNNNNDLKALNDSEVLQSRKNGVRIYGNYFLEVREPKIDDTAINCYIWDRRIEPLLAKEYYQGTRTEHSNVNKVIARRTEYGNNEDRMI